MTSQIPMKIIFLVVYYFRYTYFSCFRMAQTSKIDIMNIKNTFINLLSYFCQGRIYFQESFFVDAENLFYYKMVACRHCPGCSWDFLDATH